METEIALRFSVLPLLVLLALYWAAVLLYHRARVRRSAEAGTLTVVVPPLTYHPAGVRRSAEAIINEAARSAQASGATSFEVVGVLVPLGGLLAALLLPLVLLGILALLIP
jgi:hypothetical protein